MQSLADARAAFDHPGGYLAAASQGLPTLATQAALRDDVGAWASGTRHPSHYDGLVERSRASFARLVGVPTSRVAIGSQASVMAGMIASAAPQGAEVICVDGDFSSMVFPFLQRTDLRVRHVPVHGVPDAIGPQTWLVAFSHIQSATGVVADVDPIVAAAAEHGARTLCDTTQSAGVHPVDASVFDATICHAYKWLCAPRGVAFLTVADDWHDLAPTAAGWYAGEEVWQSCYGPAMRLAGDARRFDVSPAWQAWAGAEPALALFADLDVAEVWRHATTLGDALCDGLGIERQGQAIVTWPDADGEQLRRLTCAGLVAAGRAGRVRTAFHVWNDERDVDRVLQSLGA
ncbi:aminotransferase class V-fold PLP-dependent enzyme [Galbitalea sp. SE-J8]|uniref:aminotransferase class V-fold PLP-dependent enzyme n=1 Tax=Galbitalea sp. SE-J8 TaxID=3054952 RepID=UPI00259CDD28|nr:aminotransferase class V-fold PLP-dependent enzyme [Galbitalea sp. SE-J8]MDM4761845.1 aminotransferase class V-fold PLP-dependent enzyme [Galbitalea sp. SE-J8]